MKFCLLGIGVSLLVGPCVGAQNLGDPLDPLTRVNQEKLVELARSFDLSNGSYDPPLSSQRPTGAESVVSLQALKHQTDKRARRLADRGLREYERHHYEEALPLLEEAARIDPDSTNLQNNLGVIYSALGDDKRAEQAFEQALKADPDSAVSMSNLAAVAFNTNQYRLAEESARRALHISPLLPAARVTLAFAEIAQGHWTEEAHFYLEENRSHVPQAETILRAWPPPNRSGAASASDLTVAGAGRGISTPAPR